MFAFGTFMPHVRFADAIRGRTNIARTSQNFREWSRRQYPCRRKSISLQPLSVEGQVGVNLALGVAGMTLNPA